MSRYSEAILSLSNSAPNYSLPWDRASGRAATAAGSRAAPSLAAGTNSPPLKRGRRGDEEGASPPPPDLSRGTPPRAPCLRPARTRAGATATAGAQARFPRLGSVAERARYPPAFEPAGLQASNSQLQALLSVPRKRRRVLSFTRLEGRSCQRLRLLYQLLGAGSRWRDGTPDREQTFQGRRGRKSLRAAWPAPIPSRAKTEQTYPLLPLFHPPPPSRKKTFLH